MQIKHDFDYFNQCSNNVECKGEIQSPPKSSLSNIDAFKMDFQTVIIEGKPKEVPNAKTTLAACIAASIALSC